MDPIPLILTSISPPGVASLQGDVHTRDLAYQPLVQTGDRPVFDHFIRNGCNGTCQILLCLGSIADDNYAVQFLRAGCQSDIKPMLSQPYLLGGKPDMAEHQDASTWRLDVVLTPVVRQRGNPCPF